MWESGERHRGKRVVEAWCLDCGGVELFDWMRKARRARGEVGSSLSVAKHLCFRLHFAAAMIDARLGDITGSGGGRAKDDPQFTSKLTFNVSIDAGKLAKRCHW